jgi:SpoVK/Ycf46/Vps4 family AAA+-type ATPase
METTDLKLLVMGHVPIINIQSYEERRALEMLINVANESSHAVFKWTVTEGLKREGMELSTQLHNSEPAMVLNHIKKSSLLSIYILMDFHHHLKDPVNQRLIKEIAMKFEETGEKLIFISPNIEMPSDIAKSAVNFQLKLPTTKELENLVHEEALNWQQENGERVQADKSAMDKLIRNLSGLTHNDAKRLIRNAIMDDNAISQSDLPGVMDAKYQLMNKDDLLSFEYDTAKLSDVGGMSRLKDWLNQRQKVFNGGEALPDWMDKPKGILLLGVQGGGKSLAAKAVAGVWNVPLLRLDFGMMYNKYIGETEKNIRQALQTAEAMSPCVLWIDEIEKGISTGSDEDGTSKRILGTMLTWMAENKHAVFIVATANQIDDLPPELIRKGRLDEIFFVDLPKESVRETIFKIHLSKRNIPLEGIDVNKLASVTEGFSGSEIEQAIVSVLYSNHAKNKAVETSDLIMEIEQTRPLSVVMAEKIAYLRMWASDRTVPAD